MSSVCLIFRICLSNPAIYKLRVINFFYIKLQNNLSSPNPPLTHNIQKFNGDPPSQPNHDVHKARVTKSPPTSPGSHIYDDTDDDNLQHCCQLEKKRDANSPGGAGEVISSIHYIVKHSRANHLITDNMNDSCSMTQCSNPTPDQSRGCLLAFARWKMVSAPR